MVERIELRFVLVLVIDGARHPAGRRAMRPITWILVVVALFAIGLAVVLVYPSLTEPQTLRGPIAVVEDEIPTHGHLGIAVAPSDELDGFVVADVLEGSPAAKADVRAGDRLVSINGVPIRNLDVMASTMQQTKPKEVARIELERNTESITVDATLITYEESVALQTATDQRPASSSQR
jgi:predicted metalloprotease with PDZ domain